jgi:hypothetical protein
MLGVMVTPVFAVMFHLTDYLVRVCDAAGQVVDDVGLDAAPEEKCGVGFSERISHLLHRVAVVDELLGEVLGYATYVGLFGCHFFSPFHSTSML